MTGHPSPSACTRPLRAGAPFALAAFGLGPDTGLSGHAHDSWHLLTVSTGEFEEAGNQGGFHVRAGQVRLSPPGLAHEIRTGGSGVQCRNLHIAAPKLTARLNRDLAPAHHVADLTLPDFPDAADDKPIADLLACESVARALRACRGDDPDAVPDWLAEIRSVLLNGGQTVTSTVSPSGRSREHVSRAFSDWFGCSPVETRRNGALSRAIGLLRQSLMPVSEVALECGFYDQAHLTNAMRDGLGETPLAIRNRAFKSQNSNTAGHTAH